MGRRAGETAGAMAVMHLGAGIEVPSIWANSSSGISSSNAALVNASCITRVSGAAEEGAAEVAIQ